MKQCFLTLLICFTVTLMTNMFTYNIMVANFNIKMKHVEDSMDKLVKENIKANTFDGIVQAHKACEPLNKRIGKLEDDIEGLSRGMGILMSPEPF